MRKDKRVVQVQAYKELSLRIALECKRILDFVPTPKVCFGCFWGHDYPFIESAHAHTKARHNRGRICLNGLRVFEEYPIDKPGPFGEDIYNLICHECIHFLGKGWYKHTKKFKKKEIWLSNKVRKLIQK